jgi:hypothetical protein
MRDMRHASTAATDSTAIDSAHIEQVPSAGWREVYCAIGVTVPDNEHPNQLQNPTARQPASEVVR